MEYLYLGFVGHPFLDGVLTMKYGHTKHPHKTSARHRGTYHQFYGARFIPLPTHDYLTARRYEVLLGERMAEAGLHRGRVAYGGLPRTELLRLAQHTDPDVAFGLLTDTAEWAGEADELLIQRLAVERAARTA